jgi:glutathione S-transferase
MAYTLMGSSISPFVHKVMVFMTEKGVPYEHLRHQVTLQTPRRWSAT